MPTVEERLTSLEARVESMSDLRNIITELRGDMNGRFTDVDHRFTELRADMNLRFSEVTARFDGMQADVSRRFWDLDQKIDRHFTWVVGTQIAMFLAVVGALIGALYR